jgi:very-short-patch-repair endonuclease
MDLPFNHKASIKIFESARFLKKVPTPVEESLLKFLRNSNLSGFKFRRQHPIKTFILDFYCHQKLLAIEIDGDIHSRQGNSEYDESRTMELQGIGIKVIRFTNHEVLNNMTLVLNKIKQHLDSKP